MVTTEDQFQEIRRDDSLKQPFLDSVVSIMPQGTEKIIYDPDFSQFEAHVKRLDSNGLLYYFSMEERKPADPETSLLVAVPVPGKFGDQSTEYPIFVGKKAFQKLDILQLFLNCLVHHEGVHIADLYNGITNSSGMKIDASTIGDLQSNFFLNLLELRAYSHQIGSLPRQGNYIGNFFLELNWARFSHYKFLVRMPQTTPLEKQIIGALSEWDYNGHKSIL